MDPQIIPRTQRPVGAEPEPSLSISQLQSLLHAVAEVERAQRPIVIQPSTETATAAHGGIDVRIPAAAVTVATTRRSERSWWPVIFMVSGCAGVGSGVLTAVTSNQFAILAVFASLAGWGTAAFHLVFKEN
jgi:hypothetical protein